MLMALDQFVFGLDTLAPNEMQRQRAWKYRTQSRVGARDSRQFTGTGEESITFSGVLAPELTTDTLSLDKLEKMADAGEAYVLVDGAGLVYGAYVIDNTSTTGTYLDKLGKPRRIEFRITLQRVDDDQVKQDKDSEAKK